MRRARYALAALALVLAALPLLSPAAAYGASDHGASDARESVATRDSDYGRILFDGEGRALYAFTRDPRGRSACTGACARAWPPFLVTERPLARGGARAGLIGTIRRGGARQVTYAGRPLYYYVGDRTPGQVLCQNVREFGGLWLVVRPGGGLVR